MGFAFLQNCCCSTKQSRQPLHRSPVTFPFCPDRMWSSFRAENTGMNLVWPCGQASRQSRHIVHSVGSLAYSFAGLIVPVGQISVQRVQPLHSTPTLPAENCYLAQPAQRASQGTQVPAPEAGSHEVEQDHSQEDDSE